MAVISFQWLSLSAISFARCELSEPSRILKIFGRCADIDARRWGIHFLARVGSGRPVSGRSIGGLLI